MSATATLPLLTGSPGDPVAWHRGRLRSRGELVAHAVALGAGLAGGNCALILCTDRYRFIVALAALLLKGRTALLPPTSAPAAVAEITSAWDAFVVDDAAVEASRPAAHSPSSIPRIDGTRDAVVLFTSGSTGHPNAQVKTWTELSTITALALERLGLGRLRHDIVATVPPQHSYGFESSVLYAMLGPAAVHSERPLFPDDVRAALASVAPPRVLVTAPVHLRACVGAPLGWPSLSKLICATAPLECTLADKAERSFCAPLYEIYGCSETGAIATRRTLSERTWLPYDGIAIERHGDGVRVRGPHLSHPRPIADLLELGADGRFELRGRKADQVKVAGKRINLAELNRRLLEINGVEDGCFVVPADNAKRLAAVVVAPRLSVEEIRLRLAEVIDPVFLPRPLVRVAALRRNAAGKLARAQLLALIEERAQTTAAQP